MYGHETQRNYHPFKAAFCETMREWSWMVVSPRLRQPSLLESTKWDVLHSASRAMHARRQLSSNFLKPLVSVFFPECCFGYHSHLTALTKYEWVNIEKVTGTFRTFRNDLGRFCFSNSKICDEYCHDL